MCPSVIVKQHLATADKEQVEISEHLQVIWQISHP